VTNKPKSNYYLNNYKKNKKSSEKSQKANSKKSFQKKPDKTVNIIPIEDKRKIIGVYLFSLGIDNAVKVLQKIKKDEALNIVDSMSKTKKILQNDLKAAEIKFGKIDINLLKNIKVKEFTDSLLKKINTVYFIKSVDESAEAAKKTGEAEKPFSFLNNLSSGEINGIIGKESDIIISVILGLLEPKKSAEIIKILPHEKIVNILKIMSNKSKINPEALEKIIEQVKSKASNLIDKDKFNFDGKNKLIEILKNFPYEKSNEIINNIEIDSPDLAIELKDKIFTFEDIKTIPKKSLSAALKNFKDKNIAFLLKGLPEDIKACLLASVTKKRKMIILEEMDYLGKVKKNEVDEKRKEFIEYLKELEGKGIIILNPEKEIYIE
jgi:flagellar motor switch protein FliG